MSNFQKVIEEANKIRESRKGRVWKRRLKWIEDLRDDAMMADLYLTAEHNKHLRKRLVKKGLL